MTQTNLEIAASARFFSSLLGYEGQIQGASFGMGVVSLLQENQRSSTKLAELRRTGRVSVLFEEDGDDSIPQQEDIYRLVNFLAVLRFRAVVRDGRIGINMNLLKRP